MTYSASQGDHRIDCANSLALRNAIGEGFQVSLDQKGVEMPLHLVSLLKRLSLSELPFNSL